MLKILVTLLHVIVSLVLILVVLLQTGKRADLAGAFGGGGSQTAFGARGAATFLSKATTACAVIFMLTSLVLTLTFQGSGGSGTVLDDVDSPASTAPATPGGTDDELPAAPIPVEPPVETEGAAAEPGPEESGD